MALFRALSTRGSRRGGYDKLLDETNKDPNTTGDHQQEPVSLKRAVSVPARMLFGSSPRKLNSIREHAGFHGANDSNSKPKQQKKKKKTDKIHPIFSLFDGKWRKKKMTANPDFSRYMEYLKEGGMWNKDTNSPVIYYK